MSRQDSAATKAQRWLPSLLFSCCGFGLITIAPRGVHAAEVWFYQMKGKLPMPCEQRPEKDMDEVWLTLERTTGATWDLPRDMSMLPGIVLQSKALNREYSFYQTRQACEYERTLMEPALSGDQKRIDAYKKSRTPEMSLAAIAPPEVANKQDWVNAFAGCTDGRLKSAPVLKGELATTIAFCDCIARPVAEAGPNPTEDILKARMPSIIEECVRQIIR
jgi:hypothetical protein